MLYVNDLHLWFKRTASIDWLWIGLCVFACFATLWNVMSVFEAQTESAIFKHTAEINTPSTFEKAKIMHELQAPLFGVYVPNPKNAQVITSHLSYVIVGILYAEDSRQSQVVIRAENGFDKVYRQNEFLTPVLQLKMIQPDGVIILNQGRLERLSLPENVLRFDPPPSPLMMKE